MFKNIKSMNVRILAMSMLLSGTTLANPVRNGGEGLETLDGSVTGLRNSVSSVESSLQTIETSLKDERIQKQEWQKKWESKLQKSPSKNAWLITGEFLKSDNVEDQKIGHWFATEGGLHGFSTREANSEEQRSAVEAFIRLSHLVAESPYLQKELLRQREETDRKINQSVGAVKDQLRAVQNHLSFLNSQIGELKRENQTLKSRVTTLETNLNNEKEERRNDVNRLSELLNKEKEDHKAEVDQLKDLIKVQSGTVKKLEKRVTELEQKNENLENRLASKSEEVNGKELEQLALKYQADLKIQQEQAMAQSILKDRQIDELLKRMEREKQLSDAQKEAALEKKGLEHKIENFDLQKQLLEMKVQTATQQAQLEKRDFIDQIKELKHQEVKLNTTIAELRNQLDAANENLTKLNQEVADLKNQITTKDQEIQQLRSRPMPMFFPGNMLIIEQAVG